jgi:hypothetical protein
MRQRCLVDVKLDVQPVLSNLYPDLLFDRTSLTLFYAGGGLKLWWQKINPPETEEKMESGPFLCHACYFPKDDWSRAMPVGYEDVESYSGLLARKTQLDGLREGGQNLADESYHKSVTLRNWCAHDWVRELPWKILRPFVMKEKVYDHCGRCKRSRHRAMLFWWRSPDGTLCNKCYAEGNWYDIMPQGYEDVRNFKQLRARKKQLDMEESKRL